MIGASENSASFFAGIKQSPFQRSKRHVILPEKMEKINPPACLPDRQAGGQKIMIIVGPTASGKSDLAVKMAKKINGEIISADSRQVYKGMDIGTGKVTKKQRKQIKHHLIDVASPKKDFNAAQFKKLGEKAIKEIIKKGKMPIIVGGTGFYIDVLLGKINLPEVPPSKQLRKRLDKFNSEHLFKMLRKLDPKRAKNIDSKNKRRLIRAIEIASSGLKTISYKPKADDYDISWIGLEPEDLDKKIKFRLEKRLKQGMVSEVKKLLKQGVSHRRLQQFGLEYKFISLYLQKKMDYQKMKKRLATAIIQYSKRQMTWFKRNNETKWVKSPEEAMFDLN